jgi:hypothetical protein
MQDDIKSFIDMLPVDYQPMLRKVRRWVEATTPYNYDWSDIQLVCYALSYLVTNIEKESVDEHGLKIMAPSSLLMQERVWIRYCTTFKQSKENDSK